jgi:hypothetical protein
VAWYPARPNKAVEPTSPMAAFWYAGVVYGAAAHRGRCRKMKRKQISKTKIFNDAEIKYVSEKVANILCDIIGHQIHDVPMPSMHEIEKTMRYLSLGAKLREGRERMKITVKEVAKQLKVPQYKIKALEKGPFREFDSSVFREYISFLGVQRWFNKWKTANQSLAQELDIL